MPISGYSASEIAALIPDARRSGDGYRGPCPAHGGQDDNLSIVDSGDGAIVTCHSHHCDITAIKKALGLDTKRRSNGHTDKKSVYDYHDAIGNVVHQTVINRLPHGSKKCSQRRPHPTKPDEFIYNLKGITPVLFHLPQLIEAVANNKIILIVEGEKCVLAAERLGYTATTNAMGAGKWKPHYNEHLQDAHVAILPDNDPPGYKHAEQVETSLQGVAASVRVIELPGLPDKGDISDWIDAGGTKEQLDTLITDREPIKDTGANKKPWSAIQTLEAFLEDRVEMPDGVARDVLYPGAITIMAAPRGSVKSIIAHILARELARGGMFRDSRIDKVRVLIIDTDNPKSLVQDRLVKVCDDRDIDLHIITREHVAPLLDQTYWKNFPAESFDVVILDSFGGATPGISESEGAKLQQAMDILKGIADRGPAVLVLDNTTKAAVNYRGRGEKVDRVDIAFECRDVTGWSPSGPEWWLDLPDASDSAWQERASRHQKAPQRRLAFIAAKFRFGEEPVPFVLEVDFETTPWSFRDVTDEVHEQADHAFKDKKADHAAKQLFAVETLAIEVKRRYEAGEQVLGKREGEDLMYEQGGLKRADIRRLIDSHDANIYPTDGRWRINPIPESRGNKKGVFPLVENLGQNNTTPSNPLKSEEIKNSDFGRPHKTCTAEIPGFESQQNQVLTGVSISAEILRDAEICVQNEDPAQVDMSKILGRNTQADNSNKIKGPNSLDFGRPGNMGMAEISVSEGTENQQVIKLGLFRPSKSMPLDEMDEIDLMVGAPRWAQPVEKHPQPMREPKESAAESDLFPHVVACSVCGYTGSLSPLTGRCELCIKVEQFFEGRIRVTRVDHKDIVKVNLICEYAPELIDDVKSGKMKLFHAYREAKSKEKQMSDYGSMAEGHEEMQATWMRQQKKRIAYLRAK